MMKSVADAIKELNPNAVIKTSSPSLESDAKDTTITWLEGTPKISNTKIQNKLNALRQQEKTDQENKEAKKESGKQKLKDLGLDDDEIKALLGV